MVGGDLGELDRTGVGQQIVPHDRPGRQRRIKVEVRHDHRLTKGRKPVADRAQFVDAADVVAAVAIPIDRQQHLRLDLAEAIEHRLHTELRGA